MLGSKSGRDALGVGEDKLDGICEQHKFRVDQHE